MSNAGRSAKQMARKKAWEINPLNLYRWPILIIGSLAVVLVITGIQLVPLLILAAAFWISCRIIRAENRDFIDGTKTEYRNWKTGAEAERKTAKKLKWWVIRGRLRGEFRAVLHDRKIPFSNANIDHITVSTRGVMNWDTKEWQKPFELRYGHLYYNGSAVSTGSTAFETKSVQTALNRKFRVREELVVKSFWAIHTPRELPFELHYIDGVGLTHVRDMASVIQEQPVLMNNAKAQEVFGYLSEKFPPAHN